MIRILINTGGRRDATSLYRCMGPLSHLAKKWRNKIQIDLPNEKETYGWERIALADVLFLHRPTETSQLIALQIARRLDIPVWVDYDDWLIEIPSTNPASGWFSENDRLARIALFMACADLVTTSTQALCDRIKRVNKNTFHIANAYWSDIFKYRSAAKQPNRNEIYFWRGSNTHDEDLFSVASSLSKLSKPLHLMGSPPKKLLDKLASHTYKVIPGADPFQYFWQIYAAAPKVMLVPLKNNAFNICKSNIAWQDALHAGAVCVAPDFPEWHHPGVFHYQPNHPETFLEAAETAMATKNEDIQRLSDEAYQYMLHNFDMDRVNCTRLTLLEQLCAGEFERSPYNMYDPQTPKALLSILKANAPDK